MNAICHTCDVQLFLAQIKNQIHVYKCFLIFIPLFTDSFMQWSETATYFGGYLSW